MQLCPGRHQSTLSQLATSPAIAHLPRYRLGQRRVRSTIRQPLSRGTLGACCHLQSTHEHQTGRPTDVPSCGTIGSPQSTMKSRYLLSNQASMTYTAGSRTGSLCQHARKMFTPWVTRQPLLPASPRLSRAWIYKLPDLRALRGVGRILSATAPQPQRGPALWSKHPSPGMVLLVAVDPPAAFLSLLSTFAFFWRCSTSLAKLSTSFDHPDWPSAAPRRDFNVMYSRFSQLNCSPSAGCTHDADTANNPCAVTSTVHAPASDTDHKTVTFGPTPPTTPVMVSIDPHHQISKNSLTSSTPSLCLVELPIPPPTSIAVPIERMRIPTGATVTPEPKGENWSRILPKASGLYGYTRILDRQVRLLLIKPGAPDEELNVTLLTIDDEQLGGKQHPYQALSYHWGDGAADKPIIVQDDPFAEGVKHMNDLVKGMLSGKKEKKLFIRLNLYDALKHMRHDKLVVSAWVDALCINQEDKVEKSTQVGKMADIYRGAYNVCIWLGSDEGLNAVSAMAMDFIPQVIDPQKHDELLHNVEKTPCWASLFELLEWSWFSRRWIIQEVALARSATVHCGNSKVIHWHDFQDAIATFCRDFAILRPRLSSYFAAKYPDQSRWISEPDFEIEHLGAKLLVDITTDLFRENEDGTLESTYGLELLVCLLSSFDSSDPRDTINALINISSEYHRKNTDQTRAIPGPDYSKDLFEVYRDFVQWVVGTSNSLDIICRHWALPGREQDRALPSWIQSVDDSAFGRGHDVFEGRKAGGSLVGLPDKNRYHASGRGGDKKYPDCQWSIGLDRDASYPLGRDQSILVSGLAIGVVSFCTEPFPDGIITKPCLERLGWSSKKRQTEVTDVPKQLWQTLVANRGPKGTSMPPLYRRACQYVMGHLTRNGHINIDNLLGRRNITDHVKDYLERVRAVTWNRSFIEGLPAQRGASAPVSGPPKKLVGLGPPATMDQDIIAILYGCSVPVILHPVHDETGALKGHQFIGEAFIYGKMDGEALHEGLAETRFCLL
ncbi:hypothetical protein SVAN01_02118 [Stagonosporopsis vannaccii]|nr:hypothetical protein SVAN01_02118 [Stagonosporopsis vannaccii]